MFNQEKGGVVKLSRQSQKKGQRRRAEKTFFRNDVALPTKLANKTIQGIKLIKLLGISDRDVFIIRNADFRITAVGIPSARSETPFDSSSKRSHRKSTPPMVL